MTTPTKDGQMEKCQNCEECDMECKKDYGTSRFNSCSAWKEWQAAKSEGWEEEFKQLWDDHRLPIGMPYRELTDFIRQLISKAYGRGKLVGMTEGLANGRLEGLDAGRQRAVEDCEEAVKKMYADTRPFMKDIEQCKNALFATISKLKKKV